MTIKLFSTAGCAGCVVVKKLLDDNGVEYKSFDVMNTDDMTEASKYGVRGIPSVVVYNESGYTMITGSSPKDIAEIKQLVGV